MKIKNGDNVKIIAGKDKGKTGKVQQVIAERNMVVIEGAGEAVKHLKRRGNQQGQRIEYNAPVHVSNVKVIGKGGEGRVGYKFIEKDGKQVKVRVLKTKKGIEDLD